MMPPAPPYLLLVEDDEDDQELFRLAAARVGLALRIEEATDGEQAIAFLRARLAESDAEASLPALVVLDLKLPRRSGHDVLAWRLTQPGLRQVPFVVLTSSPLSPEVNRAMDLGANSYLVKPLAAPELQSMLRTVVQYWLEFNITLSHRRD